MSIRPSVPVTVPDEVEAMLTPELRDMMDKLTEMIFDASESCAVSVIRVRYVALYDPEDDGTTISCAIKVAAAEEQAFRYWDLLSEEEGRWADSLPLDQQTEYFRLFGTHVYWLLNEPAV
ncbi:MAG: hypothetical protein NTZ05_06215 [Chloroflexi bacterium]|nr:hypothetical protein [Chloroflexota bacterium]